MDPSPLLLLATTALSVLAALLLGAGLLRWRHRALQSERTLLAQLDEAKRARRNEDQLLEAVKSLTSESFREHSREFLELASDKHNQIESSAMARWDSQGQLLANKLDLRSGWTIEQARRARKGAPERCRKPSTGDRDAQPPEPRRAERGSQPGWGTARQQGPRSVG